MKEHPDIVKFCHFSAYVRTRSAGILRGLTPWHTDFGTKSSVLHLVRGVQAPGTHVRSDYSQTRHIGGRPSSHKANLIPQSKRQDTTIIVIPCLCSFTVPSSPSAELPINKKRTQTLFHKESGSSTNCMVDLEGFEPLTSRMRTERSPSSLASVHTLCTVRKEKSTYIRPYKIFCQPNGLLGPQVWHPSRRFSGRSDLGCNMVGGQVSYRPLRYSSHGVQMYRIPIQKKTRCTVKAQLLLSMNGSCAFYIWHQVID